MSTAAPRDQGGRGSTSRADTLSTAAGGTRTNAAMTTAGAAPDGSAARRREQHREQREIAELRGHERVRESAPPARQQRGERESAIPARDSRPARWRVAAAQSTPENRARRPWGGPCVQESVPGSTSRSRRARVRRAASARRRSSQAVRRRGRTGGTAPKADAVRERRAVGCPMVMARGLSAVSGVPATSGAFSNSASSAAPRRRPPPAP